MGDIMQFCLASASPRRRELLALINDDFIIDIPQNEEFCPNSIKPLERPEYLAVKKAEEVAARHSDCLIIAADTAVFLGEEMLGKPKTEREAADMLRLLSGNTHTVVTGCSVIYKDKKISFSVSTEVVFYPLSDEEIKAYIATGEPMDKAGSYGIQGKGAVFVREIKGDYFNVVGLPVAELYRKISEIEGK